ncbi:hypothetical protein Hanom_Chr12g01133051 [Helianthus anomalus]
MIRSWDLIKLKSLVSSAKKGQLKRECTNWQADDSVNPFHQDYYKKPIYHCTNEQPSKANQKQIDKGPSKERKQALFTIQEDGGFNWNKYIPKEKLALVAETRPSRDERHARMWLSDVFEIFIESKRANRWDGERECIIDPQGNLAVDPQKEGIRRVIYASVEKKKKTVEEIVDESQKMVDELKKTTEKADDEKLKSLAEDTVAEKQQVIKEVQNQMEKEAMMPNTEVITKTESSISSNKS